MPRTRSQRTQLSHLPNEVQLYILWYLAAADLLKMRLLSKHWLCLINDCFTRSTNSGIVRYKSNYIDKWHTTHLNSVSFSQYALSKFLLTEKNLGKRMLPMLDLQTEPLTLSDAELLAIISHDELLQRHLLQKIYPCLDFPQLQKCVVWVLTHLKCGSIVQNFFSLLPILDDLLALLDQRPQVDQIAMSKFLLTQAVPEHPLAEHASLDEHILALTTQVDRLTPDASLEKSILLFALVIFKQYLAPEHFQLMLDKFDTVNYLGNDHNYIGMQILKQCIPYYDNLQLVSYMAKRDEAWDMEMAQPMLTTSQAEYLAENMTQFSEANAANINNDFLIIAIHYAKDDQLPVFVSRIIHTITTATSAEDKMTVFQFYPYQMWRLFSLRLTDKNVVDNYLDFLVDLTSLCFNGEMFARLRLQRIVQVIAGLERWMNATRVRKIIPVLATYNSLKNGFEAIAPLYSWIMRYGTLAQQVRWLKPDECKLAREKKAEKSTHCLGDVAPVLRLPQLKYREWLFQLLICQLTNLSKVQQTAPLQLDSELFNMNKFIINLSSIFAVTERHSLDVMFKLVHPYRYIQTTTFSIRLRFIELVEAFVGDFNFAQREEIYQWILHEIAYHNRIGIQCTLDASVINLLIKTITTCLPYFTLAQLLAILTALRDFAFNVFSTLRINASEPHPYFKVEMLNLLTLFIQTYPNLDHTFMLQEFGLQDDTFLQFYQRLCAQINTAAQATDTRQYTNLSFFSPREEVADNLPRPTKRARH